MQVYSHLPNFPNCYLFLFFCRKLYPSAFLNQVNTNKKGKGKGKLYTYERDIICLPRWFGKEGELIQIPRKRADRHFLAVNKLVGKIQLNSCMTESDIFDEIRSVFAGPMAGNEIFVFKILQSSGGDSRSLMVPEMSSSYKWTSLAVAGRNAKVPIYVLAEERLDVNSVIIMCT